VTTIAWRDGEPAVGSYDSRERRGQLAAGLEALDLDPSTVEAIVLADTGQAYPPQMATATAGPTPRATPAHARPGRTLQQRRRPQR
jgi:hypothetical protein